MSEQGNKRRAQVRKNRLARLDKLIADLDAAKARAKGEAKAASASMAKAQAKRDEIEHG